MAEMNLSYDQKLEVNDMRYLKLSDKKNENYSCEKLEKNLFILSYDQKTFSFVLLPGEPEHIGLYDESIIPLFNGQTNSIVGKFVYVVLEENEDSLHLDATSLHVTSEMDDSFIEEFRKVAADHVYFGIGIVLSYDEWIAKRELVKNLEF